jgi:hypothetical protein
MYGYGLGALGLIIDGWTVCAVEIRVGGVGHWSFEIAEQSALLVYVLAAVGAVARGVALVTGR